MPSNNQPTPLPAATPIPTPIPNNQFAGVMHSPAAAANEPWNWDGLGGVMGDHFSHVVANNRVRIGVGTGRILSGDRNFFQRFKSAKDLIDAARLYSGVNIPILADDGLPSGAFYDNKKDSTRSAIHLGKDTTRSLHNLVSGHYDAADLGNGLGVLFHELNHAKGFKTRKGGSLEPLEEGVADLLGHRDVDGFTGFKTDLGYGYPKSVSVVQDMESRLGSATVKHIWLMGGESRQLDAMRRSYGSVNRHLTGTASHSANGFLNPTQHSPAVSYVFSKVKDKVQERAFKAIEEKAAGAKPTIRALLRSKPALLKASVWLRDNRRAIEQRVPAKLRKGIGGTESGEWLDAGLAGYAAAKDMRGAGYSERASRIYGDALAAGILTAEIFAKAEGVEGKAIPKAVTAGSFVRGMIVFNEGTKEAAAMGRYKNREGKVFSNGVPAYWNSMTHAQRAYFRRWQASEVARTADPMSSNLAKRFGPRRYDPGDQGLQAALGEFITRASKDVRRAARDSVRGRDAEADSFMLEAQKEARESKGYKQWHSPGAAHFPIPSQLLPSTSSLQAFDPNITAKAPTTQPDIKRAATTAAIHSRILKNRAATSKSTASNIRRPPSVSPGQTQHLLPSDPTLGQSANVAAIMSRIQSNQARIGQSKMANRTGAGSISPSALQPIFEVGPQTETAALTTQAQAEKSATLADIMSRIQKNQAGTHNQSPRSSDQTPLSTQELILAELQKLNATAEKNGKPTANSSFTNPAAPGLAQIGAYIAQDAARLSARG